MALYLSSIQFSNIRGFKDFSLSFEEGKKHRQWTVFIGDNGHGKTTILRAIALGLGDEVTSSELLALLPGKFIRMNKRGIYAPSSKIIITLRDSSSKQITITTELKPDEHGGVSISKDVSDSGFKWNDIFVCGYGSNRGIGGRMHSQYALRNSLMTLFNDRAGLLEPESILRDFALMAAQRKESADDPLREMKAISGSYGGSTQITLWTLRLSRWLSTGLGVGCHFTLWVMAIGEPVAGYLTSWETA